MFKWIFSIKFLTLENSEQFLFLKILQAFPHIWYIKSIIEKTKLIPHQWPFDICSRKFVNWCSASNWLMFSHRLIFFCLWFSSSFFYDLILMAFLRRDRKRQIFCLLKGGGLLSDGNKEKFLWQFRDFVVRFLIKGLYFPHYYQMSFWSTSPLSYLFLLSLSLFLKMLLFIYQGETFTRIPYHIKM